MYYRTVPFLVGGVKICLPRAGLVGSIRVLGCEFSGSHLPRMNRTPKKRTFLKKMFLQLTFSLGISNSQIDNKDM